MICDFKKTIEKHNMISCGDTVIVGLSGGADSMTLLHMLNAIKDDYSLKIIAAHVNHCLRGDMNFVKKFVMNLELKFELLLLM